jgi:alanyl-tRNA synthetase
VEATIAQLREAEKELEKLRAQLVLGNVSALADAAADVAGVAFVAVEVPEGTSGNDARTLAQEVRGRLSARGGDRPAVVAVASRAGGKASLVVAVTEAAKALGLSAGELVKGALAGRGGGNADLAQGGGVPAEQAPILLVEVERLVGSRG